MVYIQKCLNFINDLMKFFFQQKLGGSSGCFSKLFEHFNKNKLKKDPSIYSKKF